MHRTVRWARRGYEHYPTRESGRASRAVSRSFRAPCSPISAGHCAEELLELNAEGYAIGGLSVGEPRALSLEMTAMTAPLLPTDRPRYVMGVGMPEELPRIRGARSRHDGLRSAVRATPETVISSHPRDKVVIKQAQYADDQPPLDARCRCYTCHNFSRAYLRHLFQAGEILFSTLATLHNVTFLP